MIRKCENCSHQIVCKTYHHFWETIEINSDILAWDLMDISRKMRPKQSADKIFESVALCCVWFKSKE